MFRVLGIIFVCVWAAGIIMTIVLAKWYAPRKRRKHIAELERDNQRLDELIRVLPVKRKEPL